MVYGKRIAARKDHGHGFKVTGETNTDDLGLAEVADALRVWGPLERAHVREVLEVVRNGERTSSFCSAASASASNFWDSAGRASNHAFCFEFIIHTVSTSSSTRRRLVVGAYARNEVLLRDEVADHGRPV